MVGDESCCFMDILLVVITLGEEIEIRISDKYFRLRCGGANWLRERIICCEWSDYESGSSDNECDRRCWEISNT